MLLRVKQLETRDTVKLPTTHKTGPTTRNHPAPGVNRVEAKEAGVITLLLQAAAGKWALGSKCPRAVWRLRSPWEDALGKATRNNGRTLG